MLLYQFIGKQCCYISLSESSAVISVYRKAVLLYQFIGKQCSYISLSALLTEQMVPVIASFADVLCVLRSNFVAHLVVKQTNTLNFISQMSLLQRNIVTISQHLKIHLIILNLQEKQEILKCTLFRYQSANVNLHLSE